MTKYEEYALVTKELDVLEAKKELLRKEIEEILPEEGYKDEIVNAFWTAKKKWTYSPKIDGLTEANTTSGEIVIDVAIP